MIWTFSQLQPDCDWEDQYWLIKPEIDLSPHAEDIGQETTPVRWKVEGKLDKVGIEKHADRIQNGLRLFGRYYRGLWD
jgi:hypothetical protein